ncbi:hypothetical protein [Pseudocolwellia agarivorans]|uniref:hypothetical protein n=1 Tax=Pseudocolwellia agarivorans TaxID=1911682 RepID=UPI003F880F50
MKNSWLSKIQSAFILFVLVFNSTFSVVVAAYNTNQAQNYAKDDAVLICSGTSFKWMSKSAFIEEGKIIYIDEPENTPSEYHQIKCSYSYLIDHHTFELSTPLDVQISEIKYRALVLAIAHRPYTSFTYSTSLSRAPPYTS